jgi:prephenate dehydrogenase
MTKVYIIGIGLIGGSMAIDFKSHYSEVEVYGIDSNESHISEALQLGIIDFSDELKNISNADIVILSVPVDDALKLLHEILNLIKDSTLVFDVGSTKFPICEAITNHPKRGNFIATHPIAGTEFSGPSAARKNLFQGKTTIICEVEKTTFKLQKRALELFEKLGMHIRYMNPKSHDKHIAYVSHLSHISSFMLGKTVIEKEKDERDIFDMAGSGFESTVRLAKSSPNMWTPIFKQNKKHVIKSLEEYINNLIQFKELMENENFDALYNEMKEINKIKEILNGIEIKK